MPSARCRRPPGASWYCHLIPPPGTATWYCLLVLPLSDTATWYCHSLILPPGIVTLRYCHLVLPPYIASWYCHSPVLPPGASLRTHRSGGPSAAMAVGCTAARPGTYGCSACWGRACLHAGGAHACMSMLGGAHAACVGVASTSQCAAPPAGLLLVEPCWAAPRPVLIDWRAPACWSAGGHRAGEGGHGAVDPGREAAGGAAGHPPHRDPGGSS